ncbi:hypothetical protein STEG23_024629, partial [Scotinomys teguina]
EFYFVTLITKLSSKLIKSYKQAENFTLGNQLVCSSLDKTTSTAPNFNQLPIILTKMNNYHLHSISYGSDIDYYKLSLMPIVSCEAEVNILALPMEHSGLPNYEVTDAKGLLKVAIDNARAQEKQVQLEKTELKMDFLRERELRETLEKQLAMEQKNRAIVQKRLKKEKKAKRKLQEALEFETKRREQAEQTLKQAASADSLRVLNDSLTPEIEADRSGGRTDAERTIQGDYAYTNSDNAKIL